MNLRENHPSQFAPGQPLVCAAMGGSSTSCTLFTLLLSTTAVGVVGADGKVEIRNVQIGKDLGTRLEILKGVSLTDQLIVNPSDSLNQGMEVHVVGVHQMIDQAG